MSASSSHRHTPLAHRLAAVVTSLSLAACASAPSDELDPLEALFELDATAATQVPPATVARVSTDARTFDPQDGLDAREASALALHLQPRLRAARSEIGVARAQLVEAGLLPDPTIGWEAGNVIADFITDRKSTANSYIAGFVISWDVPRPGEIGSLEQEASARIDEARASLLATEWELVRDVHLACVRLAAAEAALRLNADQAAVADRTLTYFAEARRLGEATALQARLAATARARLVADKARLEIEVTEARQALLGLLGLPPTAPFTLQDGDLLLAPRPPPDPVTDQVQEALRRRPDLLVLGTQHAQAEARLRLEEARRFPQLSIGSGIGISIPIFSRFNGPAVETALRAREAARRRFEAAVFEARQEVHAAAARVSLTDAYVRRFEEQVLPAVEDTLRLTRAAVEAGEFTAFDVLTAQTQSLEAQTELLSARARRAEARVALDAATGRLAPTPEAAPAHDEEE